MTGERVGVVGSRDWFKPSIVERFIAGLPLDTTVVSGGARGVDTLAENAARKRGLEVDVLRPDWERLGRSAGVRRNLDLVRLCSWVVAFWDGASRGTRQAIEAAMSTGRPVVIVWPRLAPGERLPPRQLSLLDSLAIETRKAQETLVEEVSD